MGSIFSARRAGMRQAIKAAAELNKKQPGFGMAVNLSAKLLRDQGLTLRLAAMLARSGPLPPPGAQYGCGVKWDGNPTVRLADPPMAASIADRSPFPAGANLSWP